MARVYSGKKGKHGSKKPPVKAVPRWFKLSKEEVEGLVIKLAGERKNSAMIASVLRDQYGVPDVKLITGKTVTQIMRESKLYPDMPEDLLNLFKKAVELRGHLARSKKDRAAVTGLEHLESKIRRLVKYYAREGKIDPNFTYDPEKVKLIVQK